MRAVAVAAVMVAALPSAIAGADTVEEAVDDVNEAEQAVGQASRDRARLQRTISELASARNQVLEGLLTTLSEYEQRNAELEEATYIVTNLRSRLLVTEEEVIELRSSVQERAVRAYMRGAFEANTVLWSAGSFQEAVILIQAVETTAERDTDVLGNLANTRSVLGDLRDEFESERRRLLTVRDELGSLAAELESRFTATDTALGQAYRDLGDADSRYQSALSDLETAQRKLATFRGAGQWRPIVERFFRAPLVEDALWVMQCESRGNPDATNSVTDAAGLYQFLSGTWTYASSGAGFAGASRYDPEANIASAAWLAHRYQDRGSSPWVPWSCKP
ncbi:MAG: transglycosylase SLT domain-containing protein [Acidimicrobiia bacterium]